MCIRLVIPTRSEIAMLVRTRATLPRMLARRRCPSAATCLGMRATAAIWVGTWAATLVVTSVAICLVILVTLAIYTRHCRRRDPTSETREETRAMSPLPRAPQAPPVTRAMWTRAMQNEQQRRGRSGMRRRHTQARDMAAQRDTAGAAAAALGPPRTPVAAVAAAATAGLRLRMTILPRLTRRHREGEDTNKQPHGAQRTQKTVAEMHGGRHSVAALTPGTDLRTLQPAP